MNVRTVVIALTALASVPAWAESVPIAPPPPRAVEPPAPKPGPYIGFEGDVPGVPRTSEQANTWTDPYLGTPQNRISMPAFYRRIGRPDLAQRYESNEIAKYGLVATGAAVAGGGIVLGFETGNAITALAVDFFSILCGVGLVVAGIALDPNPISAVQARELADTYDRRRLGTALALPPLRPPPRLALAPAHLSRGQGLALQLTF